MECRCHVRGSAYLGFALKIARQPLRDFIACPERVEAFHRIGGRHFFCRGRPMCRSEIDGRAENPALAREAVVSNATASSKIWER